MRTFTGLKVGKTRRGFQVLVYVQKKSGKKGGGGPFHGSAT